MLRTLILLIITITSHCVVQVTSSYSKTNKTIDYCPVGTRTYGAKITQFSIAGLRKVEFYCKSTSDGTKNNAVIISSHSAVTGCQWPWNEDDKEIFCPAGGFIVGYQLFRNEDGLMSDMRLYCSNHPFTDYASHDNYWWKKLSGGKWRKALRCAFGKVVCGVRTHVIKNNMDRDCKDYIDQLRIACCDRL